MGRTGVAYTFYLPPELKKKFRDWCMRDGRDMSTVVVSLIEQLVQEEPGGLPKLRHNRPRGRPRKERDT